MSQIRIDSLSTIGTSSKGDKQPRGSDSLREVFDLQLREADSRRQQPSSEAPRSQEPKSQDVERTSSRPDTDERATESEVGESDETSLAADEDTQADSPSDQGTSETKSDTSPADKPVGNQSENDKESEEQPTDAHDAQAEEVLVVNVSELPHVSSETTEVTEASEQAETAEVTSKEGKAKAESASLNGDSPKSEAAQVENASDEQPKEQPTGEDDIASEAKVPSEGEERNTSETNASESKAAGDKKSEGERAAVTTTNQKESAELDQQQKTADLQVQSHAAASDTSETRHKGQDRRKEDKAPQADQAGRAVEPTPAGTQALQATETAALTDTPDDTATQDSAAAKIEGPAEKPAEPTGPELRGDAKSSQASGRGKVSGGSEPPSDRPPAIDRARFVQRVARAFEAVGNRGGEVRLRLSPPELGSLRVEVTVENGVLSARLEAESNTARSLLLDNLPALRERLAEQQIRVGQFDVDVMDHPQDGSPQDVPNERREQQEEFTQRESSRDAGASAIDADAPVARTPLVANKRLNVVI